MAMFLIAGGFRITGAQPDGDSIRFTPTIPRRGRRIVVLRGRRRIENYRQPPHDHARVGVPRRTTGGCSPICATN